MLITFAPTGDRTRAIFAIFMTKDKEDIFSQNINHRILPSY